MSGSYASPVRVKLLRFLPTRGDGDFLGASVVELDDLRELAPAAGSLGLDRARIPAAAKAAQS